ncbi:MAG: hypothetical protein IT344_04110 [Candidatus Dadabacteria bacterium]|nr:hypothetical protein [Candidatus Dadabacteria bacterium]
MRVVGNNAEVIAEEAARGEEAGNAAMKGVYKNALGMGMQAFRQLGNAADACLVMGLATHLGYLDFLRNVFEMKYLAPYRRHNPFVNQLEHFSDLGKDIIEIKKKKAEALTENIRKCRKQAFENTLSAFDKYCELLSTS